MKLQRMLTLTLLITSSLVADVRSAPPTEPGAASTCPETAFPTVTAAPENDGLPSPYLAVSCTDRQLVVESNGIPPYEFRQRTPNALRAQQHVWRLPLAPERSAETSDIPLLGPIALAINGLPIYGPNEGPHPDPFGDPVANDILDFCDGHTGPRGDYHYHALVVACLTAGHAEDRQSPVIGYAFDGFAIHGSIGCADADCTTLATYRSGWTATGDPRTYAWDNHEFVADDDPLTLDRCNGHVGPTGEYHYHATADFPYILGCYSGFVDPSMEQPRRQPPRRRE